MKGLHYIPHYAKNKENEHYNPVRRSDYAFGILLRPAFHKIITKAHLYN